MGNSNLPEQTVLLYEQIFLDEGNYAGNFRFCFTSLGGFFHNTNSKFFPSTNSHWDTDFSINPSIQLNAKDIQRVLKAIQQTDVQGLSQTYPSSGNEGNYFEQWTFFDDDKPKKQIRIWNDKRPATLSELKVKLDEILVEY